MPFRAMLALLLTFIVPASLRAEVTAAVATTQSVESVLNETIYYDGEEIRVDCAVTYANPGGLAVVTWETEWQTPEDDGEWEEFAGGLTNIPAGAVAHLQIYTRKKTASEDVDWYDLRFQILRGGAFLGGTPSIYEFTAAR